MKASLQALYSAYPGKSINVAQGWPILNYQYYSSTPDTSSVMERKYATVDLGTGAGGTVKPGDSKTTGDMAYLTCQTTKASAPTLIKLNYEPAQWDSVNSAIKVKKAKRQTSSSKPTTRRTSLWVMWGLCWS